MKSVYHEDDRTARAIMAADDAAKIRAAAKCITVDEDWEFIKEEVLEEVMTAKFAQNRVLLERLRLTTPLNFLSDWCNRNLMTLNEKKTQVCWYGSPHKKSHWLP